MKFVLALTSFLATLQLAHATSLHPCTPIVEAQDTIISCATNGTYYSIRVETLMSDVSMCPIDEMVEYNTAKVTVSDVNGNVSKKIVLGHGEFSYTTNAMGDATFESKKAGLDLKECATPLFGAFSIGN